MTTKVDSKGWKYSTKDLNLASYLWSLPDVVLVSDTPRPAGNTHEIFFEFMFAGKDESAVKEVVYAYLNGNALVDPLQFTASQSKLRHIIHEKRNAS